MPPRQSPVFWLIAALVALPVLWFGAGLSEVAGFPYHRLVMANLRWHGVLHRVDPVIDAIERYHRDSGRYPGSLGALVPRYLDRLPELPPAFIGSYDARRPAMGHPLGDRGYSYEQRGDSYELIAFLSRPGDHTGWLMGWTESLTYYGPGCRRDRHIGRVGRWAYFAFDD